MDRVKTRISKLEVIHIHKKLVIHTQKVIAQKDYIMKENLRYKTACEEVIGKIRTVGLEFGRKAELEVSFEAPPP